MKKNLALLLTIVLMTGCYKDDIADLKKDINDLKERLAQYENLLDALNKRLYVTSYEIKDGHYIITLSDGSVLSVRDTSSFIEIGENGNWWIDGEDTGVTAKGNAPAISIGGNGNWFIDDEDTGISAKGQAGNDASEIISITLVNGIMTFTFEDGRTISICAAVPEITLTEPAGGFVIDKMKWLRIQPQVKNTNDITYEWALNGEKIAETKDLAYVFAKAGTYSIDFKAINEIGESSRMITVTVREQSYLNKISEVYEYSPAPGQFINVLPAFTSGDNSETMRQKAEEALTGGSMISLGGFGGFVVMGFDHTIINKEGNDFIVLGNANNTWAEPGIIMVSCDINNNGLPDDEWYEIAGSEYYKTTTIKNYEITYHKPETEPSNPNEPTYIRWTDNQKQSGYISKNNFHAQTYYPQWNGSNSYTLKGTFMEAKVYDQSGVGTNWINPAYDWGYADNWPNADSRAQIDISWAVDNNGDPVKLAGIDFIKVYTGNCAEGGWLGEVSTEVSGINDLNL